MSMTTMSSGTIIDGRSSSMARFMAPSLPSSAASRGNLLAGGSLAKRLERLVHKRSPADGPPFERPAPVASALVTRPVAPGDALAFLEASDAVWHQRVELAPGVWTPGGRVLPARRGRRGTGPTGSSRPPGRCV